MNETLRDITVSQNFLYNENLVEVLINKTDITENDTVLDIGAGRGIISKVLAHKCKKVISIELDADLVKTLDCLAENHPNISVIHEDILSYSLPEFPYKVFANPPFSITSAIVTKLFFGDSPPESAHLILQKAAAERFMGLGEGYLYSLLLKPWFDMEVLHNLSREDFRPAPEVDVVLMQFLKRKVPIISADSNSLYKDFICYVITQQKLNIKLRLKKLFTHIQISRLFSEGNIAKQATIKDLSLDQWVHMFESFKKFVSSDKQRVVAGSYTEYLVNLANTPKVTRTKTRH